MRNTGAQVLQQKAQNLGTLPFFRWRGGGFFCFVFLSPQCEKEVMFCGMEMN